MAEAGTRASQLAGAALLVGRAGELAWLQTRLAAARAGAPQVLAITGEPGIGKSALAAAIVRTTADWRVIAVPTVAGTPWALLPVLHGLGATDEEAAELIATLDALAPDDSDDAVALAPVVARYLLAESDGLPVLLTLDDPPPDDPVLAALLHELVRPGNVGRLAVVLAAVRAPGLAIGAELALDGLRRDAVDELARALGHDLSPEDTARLGARTGGNPRLLLSLLSTADGPFGRLPEGVGRTLDERIAALSGPARDRLLVVTAAGELGPEDEAPPAIAAELDAAGFVDPRGRLRHGVVGERLLGRWSAGATTVVHAAAGRVRRAAEAGSAAAADAAERLVGAAGDDLGATTFAGLATAAARGRLQRNEAAPARRVVTAALERLDRLAERDDAARGELLLLRGMASNRLGERSVAAAAFAEAADLARRSDRPDLLVRAALARPRLADQMHLDLELRTLLDEALTVAADHATRARLMARRATELPFSDSEQRRQVCDEALRLAEGAEPAVLADVLHSRITALNDPGLAGDRLATAHRLTGLAGRSGDPELRFEAALALFAAALEAGRIDEVDACVATLRRQADDSGAYHHRAHALLREAALAFLRGRFDEANRDTVEAMRLAGDAGLADAVRMSGSLLTSICHMRGDPAGARMMQDRAARDPLPGFVLALFLHQAGAAEQARYEVERGLAQRHLDRAALWLGSLAAGAELADRLGDGALAAAIIDPLRAAGGTLAVTGGGVLCLGANEQFVGHALSALGRYDEAVACFEQALEHSRRIGSPPFVVRSTLGLARALARRSGAGDAARVRELAGEAAAQAELLGMAAVPAMLEDVVASLGGERVESSPPVPEMRASTTPVRLSRVGDVWTLDVDGRVTHLKTSKGLVQLAALLAEAGREIRSTQLAGADSPGDAGLRTEILDEDARRAYRRRLAELDDERRRATARGDAAAEHRAEREQDAIVTELRRLTGLGGRVRAFTDDDERARVNVTRTLRAAVERIFEAEPELGLHLAQSIRTGARCVYAPGAEGAEWTITVLRQ